MHGVSLREEFVRSLGVDQSVCITVRPVATVHNTRTAMLGGAKTNTITKVSEQVPLSTNDRIKVHAATV